MLLDVGLFAMSVLRVAVDSLVCVWTIDAVQEVAHVRVDRNQLLVGYLAVVGQLIDILLGRERPYPRFLHLLAHELLVHQQDADADTVRLDHVVERVAMLVIFHVEALQVRLEEEVPDASLVSHEIALGGVVALRTDILGHTQVHQSRRVHTKMLGYQISPQGKHAADLRASFLDGTHHVQHRAEVVLR